MSGWCCGERGREGGRKGGRKEGRKEGGSHNTGLTLSLGRHGGPTLPVAYSSSETRIPGDAAAGPAHLRAARLFATLDEGIIGPSRPSDAPTWISMLKLVVESPPALFSCSFIHYFTLLITRGSVITAAETEIFLFCFNASWTSLGRFWCWLGRCSWRCCHGGCHRVVQRRPCI